MKSDDLFQISSRHDSLNSAAKKLISFGCHPPG